MAQYQRTVLIAHQDSEQGKAWKLALETQNLKVNQVEAHVEIAGLLDTMKRLKVPLPTLILIDIGIKSQPPGQFSESPQAETVCRWIWKNQAEIKVVVLSSKLDEISEIERGWAKRRGAVDVLPKLYQENLMANIRGITDILSCDFLPDSLQLVVSRLLSLASMKSKETDSSASEPLPLEAQKSDREDIEKTDSQKSSEMQPGESDRDETVITYRGAKIRANQMQKAGEPALPTAERVISPQQSDTDDDDVIIYRGIRMKRSR